MPNGLPSNLYSGGAVTLNSLPYTQLYLQTQARKEAKNEALDNYYRDLSKSLTPAGMAANDVPDFTNKVNTWRDYVTKNRDVLNNPRDKNYANALNQESYLYNDALSHSEGSKSKVKDLNQFNQLRLSHPDYSITDAGMQTATQASLPLSKGYKPLDWPSVEYDPKEPKAADAEDLIKYENFVKNGLQMSEGQPEIKVLPDKKSKVVTTQSFYPEEAINTIARRSEWLYQTDPKFHKIVNDMIDNPSNYESLNKSFKDVYGHNLDIQHPEEFATALLLGQTKKTNTQPYAYSPTNIKINMGDQAAPSIDNYINQLKNSAADNPRNFIHNGKKSVNYEIPPSPELSEIFAIKTGSSTFYPDQIQFTETGDFLPIFYKYTKDKNGTTIPVLKNGQAVVDETLSHPVSLQEGKVRLAKKMFGEKGLLNVMASQNNSTQKQVKTYNVIDPNTGNVIMSGVSKEDADKAAQKGYKIN